MWMFNSIKIGLIASIGVVILSTVSAYAFSRVRFRGRGPLLDALFLHPDVPHHAGAGRASTRIFDSLGAVTPLLAIDNHWALIAVYLSGITLHIWTIKGYFDAVDPAMDKAAQIDGATPWQTFRYIFLPLAVPIIAVVFVLAFIGTINDYPVASVLLRSTENLTLAVGSRLYLNEFRYLWGDFAASSGAERPAHHHRLPHRAALSGERPRRGRRQGMKQCGSRSSHTSDTQPAARLVIGSTGIGCSVSASK